MAVFALWAPFVTWPALNGSGFLVRAGPGVIGTVLGRWGLIRGIRLVGPSRGNIFTTATPIPAALLGWIVLQEAVNPLEAVGGAITVYGLIRIVQSRAGDGPDSRARIGAYLIASLAP